MSKQGNHLQRTSGAPTTPSRPGGIQQADLVAEAEFYQGMLPHPRHMREYTDLYPDAAKVIFTQFHDQGTHRRSLEKFAISRQERRADLGVWFALTLGLSLIAAGVLITYAGHAYEGTALIGSTLVALTGNFIYGSQGRRAERSAKSAMLTNPDQPAHLAPPKKK